MFDVERTEEKPIPPETDEVRSSPVRRSIYDGAIIKPISAIAVTALFVLTIEWGRRSGTVVPIPFLLLYASVVISGGMAGRLAGGVSGALAAAYVVYAAKVGFGPRTLTGGEIQVLFGVSLYLGTGLILGRVRAQRDQFLKETRRHEAELEAEILARTVHLRKNQEALKSSEAKFRQMAENISEVFWMTDLAKNEMIYISPAYEKIWQRSRESLYQTPLSFAAAIHPGDRDRIVATYPKQARGDYDERYRIVRPDGTVRHIRARAFPIRNEAGEVYRVVGIADDITESQRRDEQLRQSQKMESLGTLAGGIAHELNNMLLPIMGLTELAMQEVPGGSPVHKNLDGVLRSAKRAEQLVDKILSFSRRDEAKREPLDLRRIVEEEVDLFGSTLPATIKVQVEFDENPVTVRADETQIHQVLMNLASNAVHAMGGRVGELTIRLSRVNLQDKHNCDRLELEAGAYAKLSVQDTGQGMDKETTDRIFEPFFTTKVVGQGTGMGLAMTHGIVTGHGGAIDVSSEPGAGTILDIYLPLAAEITPALAANG